MVIHNNVFFLRFLPEPVVVLLRSKAGSASLKVLDDVVENPELIWTAEMQGELRNALLALLTSKNAAGATVTKFEQPPVMDAEYSVSFRQLATELYIGGVYIRLFLKQPTFQLSNPIFFVEKLVEVWESSFNVQVPLATESHIFFNECKGDSREVVLGKEDFITLLSSCIICVVKGEGTVLDHLLSWGFVHTLCDNLKRALDTGRRGTPVTCIVRLLHQFVSRVETVDNLVSSNVDIVKQLTRGLDNTSPTTGAHLDGTIPELPKEAAFIVELLKKIFQSYTSRNLPFFVQAAVHANLPNFLLDHVVGASKENLSHVRNVSALRIHAVDLLKAMVAADENYASILQALLDVHLSWSEFRDQSHDLFITVSISIFFTFFLFFLSFFLSFFEKIVHGFLFDCACDYVEYISGSRTH